MKGKNMRLILVAATFAFAMSAFAGGKKVDWSLCEREIKESCSKEKDDHGKHECLEKLPKEKVSEECAEKNEKLEAQFKGEHGKDHKH
jgi:hypothetical protein